ALMSMLSHTDTPLSLVCGGAFALCVTLVLTLGIIKSRDDPAVFWYGAKSMFGAILILSLAWAIGPVIKEHIQTGVYLASVAKSTINEEYLVFMPVFLFFISAFIAFCTGTSWGTFAIMLPIGMEMIVQGAGMEQSVFLALSAILSGAVYGDHSSPISDTTILSAVGAGCSVQSHFITQLPYTTLTALCAAVSFVVVSYFQSTLLAFGLGVALLIGIFYILKCHYGGELIDKKYILNAAR
ncbi:Na+/H+ antiporter NhaC family protein, partial [uncultured Helicobacter sp.]